MTDSGLTISLNNKPFGECEVYHSDDTLAFNCTPAKARWYMKNKVVTIINEEPLKIRFISESRCKSYNKADKCVCCGSSNNLTKHHIIPYCYGKYFIKGYKSNQTNRDIVVMCADCHSSYEQKANEFKDKIIKHYNISNSNYYSNDDLKSIRIVKYAQTLIKHYDKIPKNKIILLENEIKKYYNIDNLSNEKLQEISNVKKYTRNHGKIIISKIKDLNKFVEIWRLHFIKNTNCKYLPKNYNISSDENK